MYQVVIIEDDPMVAAIDRQYVEMSPTFQVVRLCKNGMEGLEYLSSHPADLVILDYYTPSMTGMEFLDRLHATGRAPSVIMVTSANDSHIVQGMLSRGVLDYLVKPFQYARFQQALDRFVQSQMLLNDGSGCLDQSSIDSLVQGRATPPTPASLPLAKGLNAGTLEKVRGFFASHPGCQFTSEQVAEYMGLSRITIRRYVNHMAETEEIVSSIDYQTGGRPAIRYSLKSKAT